MLVNAFINEAFCKVLPNDFMILALVFLLFFFNFFFRPTSI